MSFILKNALNYTGEKVTKGDFFVGDDMSVSLYFENKAFDKGAVTVYNCLILPGFCDVHVHFREPGYLYKEDILTGSLSAAAGGYTDVCTMPNLNPVPDCLENLKLELDAIEQKAVIHVHPYGSLTVGQRGEKVACLSEMKDYVFAFSDDGRGVQSEDIMRQAMEESKKLGKVIAAHCEDNSLLHGGYIHDGKYAADHMHKGICSESEWGPIKRDIRLAKETGCKYHVCHVSAKESVEIIRCGKASGVDVTCETAPHYLVLDDSMLEESGSFKMNPPIRDASDREALIRGITDGTIDMIATDHAPHSVQEKAKGLEGSLMGVVGLECAFPIMYTELVRTKIISMEKLCNLMAYTPRKRFGLIGNPGFSIWSVDNEYELNPEKFKTKGRSTPFAGRRVYGKCIATYLDGRPVYVSEDII